MSLAPGHNLADVLDPLVADAVRGESAVALLLSGGVDSLSLGFALDRAGVGVHAYSFEIDGFDTPDVVAAERAAALRGWEFTRVSVDSATLRRDVLRLAERPIRARTKAQFECAWPFLAVFDAIRLGGERVAVSGVAADGHFGLSKRSALLGVQKSRAAFDAFRAAYFAKANPAGVVQLRAIAKLAGVAVVAPYLAPEVFAFFVRFAWPQLNKPLQKIATLRAYPAEFRAVGRRDHANLQLVAGVPAFFERLLDDPTLNVRGRTRVLDLCRDLAVAAAALDDRRIGDLASDLDDDGDDA